jgi:TonB family protein
VALSLGLHVALLGAATHARWSTVPPLGLIHIALASGGAAGSHEVGAPARAAESPARTGSAANTPRRARAAAPRRPQHSAVGPFADAAADHRASSIVGTDASSAGAHNGAGAAAGGGNGTGGGAGDGVDMDQRARCVYCPAPHYPLIARARGWEGTVDIGLLVLADGSVDTAKLQRSSGYGVLDDAAVAVARQSRFTPPAAHGLAVPLRGRIEYRFELMTSR